MKTKQEVIQEAWGKYWDQVKDHVDENGKLKYLHCWQIFGDGINSNRNFYDHELHDKLLNLKNCEWDMAYYPKSLEGIENNRGWTRIESESDLPKENMVFMECITKLGYQATHHFMIGDEKYMVEKYSHYKLMPFNPPIY